MGQAHQPFVQDTHKGQSHWTLAQGTPAGAVPEDYVNLGQTLPSLCQLTSGTVLAYCSPTTFCPALHN